MSTLDEYLDSVPSDRRDHLRRVWETVRAHAPVGFGEEIGPKFLTLSAEGEWYVALANQKNYMSIYLMPIYVFPEQREKLYASGKKFKGGKSCINFTNADNLPLDIVGEIIAANDAASYVAHCRRIRATGHGA